MARKAKPEPIAEESTVVLDGKTILLPASIVFSALLLSLALFFGLMLIAFNLDTIGGVGTSTSEDSEDTPDTGTDTDTGDQQEFPEAKTSIDDDPVLGNKDKAKVAIVEFSDYECPFCKRHFQQTNADLVKNYVDTGKAIIVFRDFPLSFHDPLATKEAIAAECVDDLGGDEKYYKYHDLLFTNTTSNGTGLTDAQIADYAAQVGVDKGKFSDCLSSQKFKDEVADDLKDGQDAGVQGTPGFVVGKLNDKGEVEGKLIAGAYPYADFEKILNEYLD